MKKSCLLLALFLGASAVAEQDSGNPLKVELISENLSIAPGETFYLGLRLVHPEGFHSYWKDPGIVGVPTSVKWALPEGFEAGEIEWPLPQLVKMAIYDAQGLKGEKLLMIPIRAPEKLSDPEVTLVANLSWMCCGEACNPASDVPFSITLPIAQKAEKNEETSELFERARQERMVEETGWRSEVSTNDKHIELRIFREDARPITSLEELGTLRFFTEDGQVDTDQKQTVSLDVDGGLLLEMVRADHSPESPATLPGLLHAEKGWGGKNKLRHLLVRAAYPVKN